MSSVSSNAGKRATSGPKSPTVQRATSPFWKGLLQNHGFLVVLSLRLLAALSIKTFFQPDEYYQSLEPAWWLAFGDKSGAWITWVLSQSLAGIAISNCSRNGRTTCARPSTLQSLPFYTRQRTPSLMSCISLSPHAPMSSSLHQRSSERAALPWAICTRSSLQNKYMGKIQTPQG